jgi:hypothetical protein
VIEAKDVWDAIKQPGLEAKAFIISDGIVEGKVEESKDVIEAKANRVMDAKARTVIIGYYR